MNKKRIAALCVLSGLLLLLSTILIIIKLSPPTSSETEIKTESKNISTMEQTTEIITTEVYEEITLSKEEKEKQIIEDLIINMTLEEKVGQMFFCAFRQDSTWSDIVGINDEIKHIIKNYNIGGVVLFSENIQSAEQVTNYINDLQNEADTTLFIGIDEEGGRVLRTFSLDVERVSSALNIGKTGDANNAYNAAKIIADYLFPLGFNVDFAPVADIFTNPSNTVIGDRAFSTEAETAAVMVESFSQGLLDNGILSALKHFPGHGDTNEDSHYGISSTKKTLAELYECEFIPFKRGIDAGAPFVMVGHISTPNITGDEMPAIFSNFLLQDVLRDMLGFEGIIITDSLAMGAVTRYFTSEETAVKSILAGVDMLLMPENFYEAYTGVINAVKSGEISEEQINASVRRILTLKRSAGLIQ